MKYFILFIYLLFTIKGFAQNTLNNSFIYTKSVSYNDQAMLHDAGNGEVLVIANYDDRSKNILLIDSSMQVKWTYTISDHYLDYSLLKDFVDPAFISNTSQDSVFLIVSNFSIDLNPYFLLTKMNLKGEIIKSVQFETSENLFITDIDFKDSLYYISLSDYANSAVVILNENLEITERLKFVKENNYLFINEILISENNEIIISANAKNVIEEKDSLILAYIDTTNNLIPLLQIQNDNQDLYADLFSFDNSYYLTTKDDSNISIIKMDSAGLILSSVNISNLITGYNMEKPDNSLDIIYKNDSTLLIIYGTAIIELNSGNLHPYFYHESEGKSFEYSQKLDNGQLRIIQQLGMLPVKSNDDVSSFGIYKTETDTIVLDCTWGNSFKNYDTLMYKSVGNSIKSSELLIEQSIDNTLLESTDFIVENRCISFPDNVQEQEKKTSYTIYPNPTINSLTISSDKNEFDRFIIRNNIGSIIQQQNFHPTTIRTIHELGLPTGIYYITIINYKNEAITEKLFVFE